VRIHPRLLRALLVRGSLAWLFARVLAAGVLAVQAATPGMGGSGHADSIGGVAVTAWVLGFSAALVYVDLRRRRELMLLRNLGVSPGGAVVMALGVGTLVEAARLAL
jgi:hypothetical protein